MGEMEGSGRRQICTPDCIPCVWLPSPRDHTTTPSSSRPASWRRFCSIWGFRTAGSTFCLMIMETSWLRSFSIGEWSGFTHLRCWEKYIAPGVFLALLPFGSLSSAAALVQAHSLRCICLLFPGSSRIALVGLP